MNKLLSHFKSLRNLKTLSISTSPASFCSIKPESDPKILRHITSPYGGATIGPEGFPDTKTQFEEMLPYTISYLINTGIIGIWIDFETEKCDLIPVAIQNGFKYHHAKDGYVSMSKWLEEDTPDRMPHFATHYITVQGIAQDKDSDKILLLKEKYGHWRLPGGIMSINDNIASFIQEKISSELGVESDFEYILGFKEQDIDLWDQPSFNFFANLKASSNDIIIKSLDIEKAEWVTLEESLNRIKPTNLEAREFIEDAIKLRNTNGAKEFRQSAEKGELLEDLGFKNREFGIKGDHGAGLMYKLNIVNRIKK